MLTEIFEFSSSSMNCSGFWKLLHRFQNNNFLRVVNGNLAYSIGNFASHCLWRLSFSSKNLLLICPPKNRLKKVTKSRRRCPLFVKTDCDATSSHCSRQAAKGFFFIFYVVCSWKCLLPLSTNNNLVCNENVGEVKFSKMQIHRVYGCSFNFTIF